MAVDLSDVEPRITAGALRMRASRQRRREGRRCLTLDVRDTEIDRLVALGLLRAVDRDDPNEVLLALYQFLDGSARSVARIADTVAVECRMGVVCATGTRARGSPSRPVPFAASSQAMRACRPRGWMRWQRPVGGNCRKVYECWITRTRL